MSNEFRHMRLADNEHPKEVAEKIFKEQMHGVLAINSVEGYPYAVPLNYVYKDGKIFFHGAVEGQKYDAIKNADKVSFCVISKDDIVPEEFNSLYESAIAFGRIRILESDEERTAALVAILEKYCADYIESGMEYIKATWDEVACFEIDIEHMTGKFGTSD